ncbi:MAG: PilN domain-containing protein [Candidatus Liptonbacteria bacterium]|nr:PilN domain-containing protein [Candidatus Liptonbacteria bacterium]
MAQYTRSAAEQFRPEESSVGWLWNIFVFSIIVFGSVLLLYLGMSLGYETFLTGQAEDLRAKLAELKEQITPEDQKNLAEFYSQVYNTRELVPKHSYPTQLFDFLEENTNEKIYYTTISYSGESANLSIQGVAVSYEFLAKQLEALRRRPEIESAILSRSALLGKPASEAQVITFDIKAALKKEFLLKQ